MRAHPDSYVHTPDSYSNVPVSQQWENRYRDEVGSRNGVAPFAPFESFI